MRSRTGTACSPIPAVKIGRYIQAFIAQMVQTTACKTMYQAPRRCARRLVMTHDRMDLQDSTLSHEFLAVMLGVQRPTVSLVAAKLQRARLIRHARARPRAKPPRVEKSSCECYAISARSSNACDTWGHGRFAH